jgi:hypothetical protein
MRSRTPMLSVPAIMALVASAQCARAPRSAIGGKIPAHVLIENAKQPGGMNELLNEFELAATSAESIQRIDSLADELVMLATRDSLAPQVGISVISALVGSGWRLRGRGRRRRRCRASQHE